MIVNLIQMSWKKKDKLHASRVRFDRVQKPSCLAFKWHLEHVKGSELSGERCAYGRLEHFVVGHTRRLFVVVVGVVVDALRLNLKLSLGKSKSIGVELASRSCSSRPLWNTP